MSVTLSSSSGIDDGQYMLRVTALDAKGPLPTKKVFREERVQASWEAAYEKDKNLNMNQFRLEHNVAFSNESEVFSVVTTDEPIDPSNSVDKRAKVDSVTQAIIDYRISHLINKAPLEIPDDQVDRNAWKKGNLNNTYLFDFGTKYAYQIQLPKKLIQLEKTFLDNENEFGFIEAHLSANPTDTTLLDPTDTAIQEPKFVAANKLEIRRLSSSKARSVRTHQRICYR